MKFVTKRPAKCKWCNRKFAQKNAGRPALYCSAAHRQRDYEKRKWTPYDSSDALALDTLPRAAQRKLVDEVRRAHMVELLTNGIVPLRDIDQIDEVLDKVKPPERMPLLRQIENACRRLVDDKALDIIASWRLARQLRP